MTEQERFIFFKNTNNKQNTIHIKLKCDSDEWKTEINYGVKKYCISGNTEYIDEDKNYLSTLLFSLEWVNSLKEKNIVLYTSNIYITNCINWWISKWKRNDFKKDDGCDRPNSDILRKIAVLIEDVNIKIKT